MTIQIEKHHQELLQQLRAISDKGMETKARIEAAIAVAQGELAETFLQAHLMTVLKDKGIPMEGQKVELTADCGQVNIPDAPRPNATPDPMPRHIPLPPAVNAAVK